MSDTICPECGNEWTDYCPIQKERHCTQCGEVFNRQRVDA